MLKTDPAGFPADGRAVELSKNLAQPRIAGKHLEVNGREPDSAKIFQAPRYRSFGGEEVPQKGGDAFKPSSLRSNALKTLAEPKHGF